LLVTKEKVNMTPHKAGSYVIMPQKKLVLEYYRGQISMSDLIHFKEVISEEPHHNFYFNTLIDFRDAKLVIGKNELETILKFFRKKFKSEGSRNVAYLTSTPNEVVLTKLFSLLAYDYADLNFNLQTFSTIEAASNWFSSVSVDSETLKSALSELKNSPNKVFENAY
jgi:hypothetical protein